MIEKQLYRVGEVASILSVSKRTVYRLLDDRLLIPHNVHPGRKGLRVLSTSIQEYVTKHQISD